jgi:membrane protease YdiL (CAAX protease family)
MKFLFLVVAIINAYLLIGSSIYKFLHDILNLGELFSYFLSYFLSYFMLLAICYNFIEDDLNNIKENNNLIKHIFREAKNINLIYYITIFAFLFLTYFSLKFFNFNIINVKLPIFFIYSIIHLTVGIFAHEVIWQGCVFKYFLTIFGYRISLIITAILYSINYSVFLNLNSLYLFSSIKDFTFIPILFSFYFIIRIFLCIRYVKKWNIYFSIAFHYASYLILCFLLLIIYLLNFNLQ